jgi:hypothetical protein
MTETNTNSPVCNNGDAIGTPDSESDYSETYYDSDSTYGSTASMTIVPIAGRRKRKPYVSRKFRLRHKYAKRGYTPVDLLVDSTKSIDGKDSGTVTTINSDIEEIAVEGYTTVRTVGDSGWEKLRADTPRPENKKSEDLLPAYRLMYSPTIDNIDYCPCSPSASTGSPYIPTSPAVSLCTTNSWNTPEDALKIRTRACKTVLGRVTSSR